MTSPFFYPYCLQLMIWPILILVSLALSCRGSDSGEVGPEGASDGAALDSRTVKTAPDGDVFIPNGCVEVSYVVDGDTFHYRDPKGGKDIKVRMLGINTREEGQTCYETGRNALASLLRGKYVRLERDPSADNLDQYDRELRYVTPCESDDTGSINIQMIRGGWACVLENWVDGLELEGALRAAQNTASQKRPGCWRDNPRFCSQ